MKNAEHRTFNSLDEIVEFKVLKDRKIENHTVNKSDVDNYTENSIKNEINLDLSGLDFSWCEFNHLDLRGCCFENAILRNAKFVECNLSGVNLSRADLFGADLRGCDLSYSNCDGTDFTASMLIGAKLDGLVHTEKTKFFRLHCPETGYFFGYKKCFNNRMVKLLIPKDAKRCSATTNACRCDKAKVVEITSIDKSVSYKEATSYVDADFIYRLGEYCYADSYNDDRWQDSSHGIHFWMTYDEAKGYM